MRYGFVKTRASTIPVKVADVESNTSKIVKEIKRAAKDGVQLLVFHELCVCGYTCGDLFNQRTLIEATERAFNSIKAATAGCKTLCFIGAPVAHNDKLYNCAVAVCNGSILGIVPKTHIPNYGEFYERRYFTGADGETAVISFCGEEAPFATRIIFKADNMPEFAVACEICEDLWVANSPSVYHTLNGANLVVNLSCSDETVGKEEYRRELVKIQSAKLVCGYVYCDAGEGESSTDMVFAGHDLICENGAVLGESKPFEGRSVTGEIDVYKLADEKRRMSSAENGGALSYKVVGFSTEDSGAELERDFPATPFVPADGESLAERTRLILTMQAKGLAQRIKHVNSKTAVIGVSGGLDSALALLVIRRAFALLGKPAKDIIAVTMPGFGTSSRTYDNSLKLIKAVGATLKTVSIVKSVTQHLEDIGHGLSEHDVTYENAQARMRTMILMDIANETGGLVVGTGDLSELALGWATYNGDQMSMYGVNCSVPKTLVKHLVRAEAVSAGGEIEEVLLDILGTEISPELLPPSPDGKIAQKTEDLVGPYILHDFFLYYALRWGYSPEKISYIAKKAFKGVYDEKTVDKWLKAFYKRFFSQQFKRSCSPDGVKVGSVTLSPRGDWRMPSDACAALWLNSIK